MSNPSILDALERLRMALAQCPHPRGTNGQPDTIEIEDGSETRIQTKGVYRDPLVELISDDIHTLARSVPKGFAGLTERTAKVMRDLARGQLPHLNQQPPAWVLIKVDDAYDLRDLAEAALAAAVPALRIA